MTNPKNKNLTEEAINWIESQDEYKLTMKHVDKYFSKRNKVLTITVLTNLALKYLIEVNDIDKSNTTIRETMRYMFGLMASNAIHLYKENKTGIK